MKKVLAIVFIFCLLSQQIAAGPLSCASCFGYGGTMTAGIFTSAGACFPLTLPWLVCGCLASLGIGSSIATVVICLPICLAPTP